MELSRKHTKKKGEKGDYGARGKRRAKEEKKKWKGKMENVGRTKKKRGRKTGEKNSFPKDHRGGGGKKFGKLRERGKEEKREGAV